MPAPSLAPPPTALTVEGRQAAPRRGLPASGFLARLGLPLFWLLLAAFILAPCACFLLLAVSPRLFSQGSQWFTLTYLHQALTGATAVSIVNSLWVATAAALIGIVIGFPIAWLAARTTLPGRRLVPFAMWLVLLLPSWLPSLGWERIVQPDGVMYRLGLDWPWVTHAIMGPFGVVLLLGLRCVPFSFLAITAALAGLGEEFEDAARVHGASRSQALRLIIPILAPAIMSAVAIGFAESISDFGVAATLAYNSNFPWPPTSCTRRSGTSRPASRWPRAWAGCSWRPSRSRSPCRPGRCGAGPTPSFPAGPGRPSGAGSAASP